jgi:Chemotaxis phosphatase CheX
MSVFTDLDEHVQVELDVILTDVLSSILAEEAIATRNSLPGGPLVVARLAIHDQVNETYASVEVRTGVGLGRVLAGRMMAMAAPDAEDVVDAVAEVGNIVGGNVKTLLCHHARLSLPISQITEQAPYAAAESELDGTCVRAIVLGHVAQLAIQPHAAVDGLVWPPSASDESEEERP